MRPIDADALEKEGWSLHRTIRVDKNTSEYQTMPLANVPNMPDDDRLERCRFEYVNACKILAHRTPDTSKGDIHDAYAVIKALYPIFGEEEF